MPHETVGSKSNEVDQVVIVMIQEHLPALFGPMLGVFLVSLILVAIMAASMSTADSNLHALSAVLTRDVYDRIRPQSSEKERAWIGRGVIVVVTLLALWMVKAGSNNDEFKPLELIATLSFVAMAFSCQLLPPPSTCYLYAAAQRPELSQA